MVPFGQRGEGPTTSRETPFGRGLGTGLEAACCVDEHRIHFDGSLCKPQPHRCCPLQQLNNVDPGNRGWQEPCCREHAQRRIDARHVANPFAAAEGFRQPRQPTRWSRDSHELTADGRLVCRAAGSGGARASCEQKLNHGMVPHVIPRRVGGQNRPAVEQVTAPRAA